MALCSNILFVGACLQVMLIKNWVEFILLICLFSMQQQFHLFYKSLVILVHNASAGNRDKARW